ncbi:endo-1,3-alpha-glucanase family glycosylhydrolase [Nocardioides aurantiacus]|uniref:Glycosyl hydrolase family 71 n=1 Tax=Nocardioides aurantiacus TaxID=86796 RepID=A0A3N2CWJ3_9ACTN|nr:endo-1,3-alpha-glucanase family glycosylhydrolase [Nocardioides aurantiacus]ROR91788.1 glycosyl hydrolase family 71 [Nocardioides aurantiacus]
MAGFLAARPPAGTPPPTIDTTRFVDAHDMTSSALDMNQSGTYFANNYINPAGEGGVHAAYGGFTRDQQIAYPGTTTSAWQLEYARTEVARAKAAGIDGFLGNMMSASGDNQTRALAMAQACAEDGTMRYTPNVDTNGSIASLSAAGIADVLEAVYETGSARVVGGKYLLSSFKAEGKTVAWWTALKTELANRGYPVEFIAVLLNASDANMEAFAPISWALSVWGPARPQNVVSLAGRAQKAHALGRKWMGPIRPQDFRPRDGDVAEAQNTDLWRGMWGAAMQAGTSGADCVQLVTWDDYAEHTHISPSVGGGYAWAKLTKVYGAAFKAQASVAVTSPLVVLTHRKHPAAATPSNQTELASPTLDGTSTMRNTTEALCILPAAGTVSVNGGTATAVPANTPTAVTAPLVVGGANTAVVTGQSGGTFTVTSAHTTTATPAVQDLHYKATVYG